MMPGFDSGLRISVCAMKHSVCSIVACLLRSNSASLAWGFSALPHLPLGFRGQGCLQGERNKASRTLQGGVLSPEYCGKCDLPHHPHPDKAYGA